ncbi:HAD family hydrolase [Roseinatronobacter alkalisoli]|uniref:HAD family phosphatase n=1 Tax=Roseinatronobacter alkalisoli TaxID=3028235 RepID=A0ABT5T9Z6_9RHOB|nr:HAD family phosphatase [Roseinatronobacter sp. HJB301]MDD7971935.1 HAD family phosphatase [Roseinatronobacter sp. HJB301]
MNDLPRALIFDCDGTLLLTADIHFTAISTALDNQGVTIEKDWYLRQSGLSRLDLVKKVALETGAVLDVARFCRESIGATVALAHCARPNPPVVALARDRSNSMPKALATNSELPIVTAFLHATRLSECFDVVVTREDVSQPKPHPAIFLLAARQLGIDPQHCLVFEDSPEGLAAADSAGMKSIDVNNTDIFRNSD